MNNEWLIGIIVLETTIIGFFVRVHWVEFEKLKRDVAMLMKERKS